MISPSPESKQPPMSPTTHHELLSLHPSYSSLVIHDPSVETFGHSLQDPSFGDFVPGEVMGHDSFGRSICAEDMAQGLKAERRGGVGISLSEIKDGECLGDLGKGLPVGDVEIEGRILGSVGGVSAEMAVLDEFCCENVMRGVARGSDEISLLVMKEKLVFGDLEKGFVEGGVECRQKSEISLLELKKKQLLSDLDNGCVFGEVVGARVLENEDVSEGTLVLDKFCNVDGKRKVARELCADHFGKMKGGEGGNDGFDLRRSLKIEVIDDTAVVEQFPIRVVHGMVKKDNEMPSCPKNQKEEVVDGKKAPRVRSKAKSLHRNEEILGKQEDVNAHFQNNQAGSKLMYSRVEMEALRYVNIAEQHRNEEILGKQEDVNAHFQNNQAGSKLMYSRMEMEALRYVNIAEQHRNEEILGKQEDVNAHFQNNQAGSKLMYSRVEMEALRYVNIAEQRRFWSQIYDGLGLVAKEYMSLLNGRAQPGPNVDCLRQSLRRERTLGILGEVNSNQVSVELGNLGQNMNKVVGLPNSSLVPDPIALNEGNSNLEVVESCEDSENDDEYYASMQRPAFLVEGEPNFDGGPPEDGLEYLRRVRWEAAQIPDVKVAKLDSKRWNKGQSAYMPEIPEIPDCPVHLLPLKQWEDAFLADFSKLRLALSGVESNSQLFLNKLQPLISCSDLNPPNSVELEDEQACPGDEGNGPLPAEEAVSSEIGHESPPRLSVILRMDSVARVSMLKKHVKKAEAMTSMSRNNCRWLFALCAVVDMPLDADSCAALRSLLRKCASLRAEKAQMDDEVMMLNILATIAGKYFGQSG